MAEPKTRAKSTRSRATKKSPPALKSFNPRTGKVMNEIATTDPAEVAQIVANARKVAPEWAAISPEGRARMMRQVRHRIYELSDQIVETVAAECGKPRTEALAHDVMPAIIMLLGYEKIAAKALKDRRIGVLAPRSFRSSWPAPCRGSSSGPSAWSARSPRGTTRSRTASLRSRLHYSRATPSWSSHRRSPRVVAN